MRIVLLLAVAGCTSEPVSEGRAHIELDSTNRGVAGYRVVTGSNDSGCLHGTSFVPRQGADVRFGPAGGDLVRLAETGDGVYVATAPATYAPQYHFTVDGELFVLDAPPDFSATLTTMSASRASIVLTDASTPSDVVIRTPRGQSTARTVVGSPATIEADFSASGDYVVDVLRTVEAEHLGSVEIQRQLTLTVP